MSQTFTYGLNEQQLRTQLINMNVPLKEDAWLKFESICESLVRPAPASRFPQLHLNVNRNVLLPAAFGAVIILFSFLLFNFTSIETEKQSAKADQQAAVIVPAPAITKDFLPVAPSRPAAAGSKAPGVSESSAPESFSGQPIAQQHLPADAHEKTAEASVVSIIADPETTVRKKHRKRSEIAGAEAIEQIRPSGISEDTEPEIRPN